MEFLSEFAPSDTEISTELVKAAGVFAKNLVLATLILVAGFWGAGILSRLARRALSRTGRIDETVVGFLSAITRYAVVVATVVAVLSQFGVETTSIVAVLGAATLAVGLALQGSLGHVAAGVMLLIIRPYRIGDFVEVSGESGTVESLDLFSTHLKTLDNKGLIIPNGNILSGNIINFTANDTRRFEIAVGIDYDDDINLAIKTLVEAAAADERVLKDPAPWAGAIEFGDSSINMLLRAWTKKEDFWQTRTDMMVDVKAALDKAGISIPYPHQVEFVKKLD